MKAIVTFSVLALHAAIISIVLIQPGCNSNETTANNTIADTNAAPAVGSGDEFADGLRLPPTRPSNAYVAPTEELVRPTSPSVASLDLDIDSIAPIAPAEPKKYTVKSGDNLVKIARANDTTKDEILELNPNLNSNSGLKIGQIILLPASAKPASAIAPKPSDDLNVETQSYVVQKGDSLSKIARKYNTSVAKIMSANSMSNSNIRIGKKIKIPAAGSVNPKLAVSNAPISIDGKLTHKVERGETLGGIAIKYGVSTKSLMEANRITDPRKLRADQILVIPEKAAPAKPVQTAPAIPVNIKPETTEIKPTEPVAPSNVPADAINSVPAKPELVQQLDV